MGKRRWDKTLMAPRQDFLAHARLQHLAPGFPFLQPQFQGDWRRRGGR